MEKQLKPSAERAFSITRLQYDKGAATLMDFLDAQRTYIATNVEYLQDLDELLDGRLPGRGGGRDGAAP